jgi:hypothetical protein
MKMLNFGMDDFFFFFFNNSKTHTQLEEMADLFMDRSLIFIFGMGGGLSHDRIEQPRRAKTIKIS